MDTRYNAGATEVVLWRQQERLPYDLVVFNRQSVGVANSWSRMPDVDPFEREHGFTQEELRARRQVKLNELNGRRFGSLMYGGCLTVKDEDMDNYLEQQKRQQKEEEEAREEQKQAEKYERQLKKSARWMWFMDSKQCNVHAVEILVDTGTGKNIITEGMVTDYGLYTEKLKQPVTFDLATGPGVVCYHIAKVSWMGRENQHRDATFYVLPSGAPPNQPRIDKPLLGRESLDEFQDLLLTEKPTELIAYTALKGKTVENQAGAQQLRLEVSAERERSSQEKKAYQQKTAERRTVKDTTSSRHRHNNASNNSY